MGNFWGENDPPPKKKGGGNDSSVDIVYPVYSGLEDETIFINKSSARC